MKCFYINSTHIIAQTNNLKKTRNNDLDRNDIDPWVEEDKEKITKVTISRFLNN